MNVRISAAARLSAGQVQWEIQKAPPPESTPHPQVQVWNKRRGANSVIYGKCWLFSTAQLKKWLFLGHLF